MSLIVQKFVEPLSPMWSAVRHVAQIITNTYDQGNSVIAVVSAQGDTTDELIAKAAEITDKPSSREMDVLLSTGEQISMSLLAMAIEQMGYPVISLTGWQAGFLTESTHRNARIKKINTERLQNELDKRTSSSSQASRASTATTTSPPSAAAAATPARWPLQRR